MSQPVPPPQIAVLDTGGQYTHLITRRVRELGVYADIVPSETPVSELSGRKGLIISGGPHSVYEPGSPDVAPELFESGIPVLGICYGQQLMARRLGGVVRQGPKGEYGLAYLELGAPNVLHAEAGGRQQIWMSHRDTVEAAPPGFEVIGRTDTCSVAVMVDDQRRLYGIQYHPEVVQTEHGQRVLANFLFNVCQCEKDWSAADRLGAIEEQVRQTAGSRNVIFFVSGGVDSTVAYKLCLRALGPERVHGYYVDTGLMRDGETESVEDMFRTLGATHFTVDHAAQEFLGALEGVVEPERKRHIIGEQFVRVQERILESGHYLGGDWILGQGTIYPDTIESGGSAKADLIKTHHNRVAGIQRLIEAKRIVEPLAQFYKDEVREIGQELGLPSEFLHRHPFPGPGLAIRCLGSEADHALEHVPDGYIVPIHSVGVQGDSRSYRPVLVVDRDVLHEAATGIVNRLARVNRVAALVESHVPLLTMLVHRSGLSAERLNRLRRADAIVRAFCHETGFEQQVWQFPVVLIPLGTLARPDSVVLRPVSSVDGMTAQSAVMPPELLAELTVRLLALDGVCGVLYDLTHKPPGTIEWE